MAHRAGSATLPLHRGQVPKWLADRMPKAALLKNTRTLTGCELTWQVTN